MERRIPPSIGKDVMPLFRIAARGLGAILVLACLIFPVTVGAGGEVILHLSDTHVTATQVGHVPTFVDVANTAADGVTLVVHSGDVADAPVSAADYQEFWNQMGRMAAPRLVIPGNHDTQWSRLGYDRYPTATAGDFAVIGMPPFGIDFLQVEAAVRSAAHAGKRIILVEHYPLMIPSWVVCPGGPCVGDQWLLYPAAASAVRDLVARYDVEAILTGHMHDYYVMHDATLLYNHITASTLWESYNVIVEDGGHLAVQEIYYSNAPIAVTGPIAYDSQTGIGDILQPAPIRIRLVGAANAAQVQSVAITKPAALTAVQVAPGIWEASYDWKRLIGVSGAKVSALVTFSNSHTQSVEIPVHVGASYPNPLPTVQMSTGAAVGNVVPVSISVADNTAELKAADLFLDGAACRPGRWQVSVRQRFPGPGTAATQQQRRSAPKLPASFLEDT